MPSTPSTPQTPKTSRRKRTERQADITPKGRVESSKAIRLDYNQHGNTVLDGMERGRANCKQAPPITFAPIATLESMTSPVNLAPRTPTSSVQPFPPSSSTDSTNFPSSRPSNRDTPPYARGSPRPLPSSPSIGPPPSWLMRPGDSPPPFAETQSSPSLPPHRSQSLEYDFGNVSSPEAFPSSSPVRHPDLNISMSSGVGGAGISKVAPVDDKMAYLMEAVRYSGFASLDEAYAIFAGKIH